MRPADAGLCVLALVLVGAAFVVVQEEVRGSLPIVSLEGPVDDCGCPAAYLAQQNRESIHPAVSKIEDLRYFQYFKVNYWSECALWEEEFSCTLDDSGLSGCHICPCDADDIPDVWKCEDEAVLELPVVENRAVGADLLAASQDVLDTRVSGVIPEGSGHRYSWIAADSSEEFINLKLNPERNTGYVGEEASRVWRAIYEENCFTRPVDEQCLEERVFYRLISGLQASIACHVSERFHILSRPSMSGQGPDKWEFGANVELFSRTVGRHRERLNNMFFVWLFLLRAVEEAQPLLLENGFTFETGDKGENWATREAVEDIYEAVKGFHCQGGEGQCGFDESSMFTSSNKTVLEEEFRSKFRNVSAIMDCVMCQNCRVHGKLSTLGLATALKILLDIRPGEQGRALIGSGQQLLSRNEVVALFQTFYKFTKAVAIVDGMQARVEAEASQLSWVAAGVALATFLLLFALLRSIPEAVLLLAVLEVVAAMLLTYNPALCRGFLQDLAGR